LQQQQKTLDNFQNQINQLLKLQNTHKTEDILSETGYLIELANLYLQTDHNIPNAIKTLSLAKQHLQSADDPRLLALQQAITSDLALLAETPVADKSNVLLQLQFIGETISKLNPLTIEPTTNLNNPAQQKKHWWKKISNNLKSLIIIQYNPANKTKPYSSEQKETIKQDIVYNLRQAEWAVLQEQQTIYQQSIINIKNDLSENYAQSPARDKMIAELDTLSQQSVEPKIPPLTHTNQALAQVSNVS
jgi:uroporphyrin-3 C-methyltransferase